MPHKLTALFAQIYGYDDSMQNLLIDDHHLQGGRPSMLKPVLCRQVLLCWVVCGIATAHAEAPTSYTLVINLTPAVCATNPELRRLRQCQEGFSLTVSQLQPEPPSQRDCAQEAARLSPLQARVVERIMPDEQLRNDAWRTSGSCTGMSVNAYFRTITNYAGRLKVPAEFNADQAVLMQKEQLVQQLVDLNAGLKINGLQLNCAKNPKFRQPMLTEIRVCYSPNGSYIDCPATVQSNCPDRFVVHGAP